MERSVPTFSGLISVTGAPSRQGAAKRRRGRACERLAPG